jgi:2,3-bisphosphoglycerate-independent phosphoglycerate mutase
VSDGGVHSHIGHLFALLKTAKAHGVPKVFIHFFGDGRDTAPRSATKYLAELQDFCKENGVGEVATVVGRYYAMDRDKRWERIKIAVDGLVSGVGEKTDDPIKAIEANYEKDVTDEFLKPIICGSDDSRIQSELSLSPRQSVRPSTGTRLAYSFDPGPKIRHLQRETPCSLSTTDPTESESS